VAASTFPASHRRRPVRIGNAGSDPRTRYFNAFCASVLVVFAALWVLPLLWALVTSLRPEGEVTTNPTSWWSAHWTVGAYRSILGSSDMATWYMNSFLTSALSAALTVLVCSMAGFALSRTGFRGNKLIATLLLAGLLIPGQVLILPMFAEFSKVHLLNTYWALVLPSIPTPVAVFVFISFFNGLPDELVDAAKVDGAGWLRVYSTIFMPLCKPAISAVAIFTFVWSWNSLLWPLLVMTSTKLMTIPVGLATVQSAYGIQYARVMASAVLGALPLVVVFLLFQRRIVEGVANTGIK
jgi:multiple sugar transport system permease protein